MSKFCLLRGYKYFWEKYTIMFLSSTQDTPVHRPRGSEAGGTEWWRADLQGESLLGQGGLLEPRCRSLHPPVGQSALQ